MSDSFLRQTQRRAIDVGVQELRARGIREPAPPAAAPAAVAPVAAPPKGAGTETSQRKAVDGIARRLSAFLNAETKPQPEQPLPRGILGGLAKVRGVVAKPELNGKVGRLLNFNVETRRFAVKLPAGDVLALRPQNLEPVDKEGSTPLCEGFTSGEFVSELQQVLDADGSSIVVHDITDSVRTTRDLVSLVWLLLVADSNPEKTFGEVALYCQRDESTSPFFLVLREILCAGVASNKEAPAASYLLTSPLGGLIVPTPKCKSDPPYNPSEKSVMLRMCSQNLRKSVRCSVCETERHRLEYQVSLPCQHAMCATCLPKAFGAVFAAYGGSPKGPKCPICATYFPTLTLRKLTEEEQKQIGGRVKHIIVDGQ